MINIYLDLLDPAPFLNAKTIGYVEMTEEEKKKTK